MNDTAIRELRALHDQEPARLISRVRLVWPEIRTALQRGHTLKRIHALLRENGFSIHYQVLSRYVCRLRREDAEKQHAPSRSIAERRPQSNAPSGQDVPRERATTDTDPLANIRDRLIRNRPGFNYEGGEPDLSKLI
jgi:hypothetical protein